MTLGERLGLSVSRHRRTGRWMVSSHKMARATAHRPSNITKAAKLAAREAGLEDALVWDDRLVNSRRVRVCWIPREVLEQMRLHNVPRCWIVRDIIAEYVRLLEMHEAAEPAPDIEIRSPDPEPAETLKPAPPWQVSWRITDAIELLGKADAPAEAMTILKSWNDDRRWQALQGEARSWTDVSALCNSGRLP